MVTSLIKIVFLGIQESENILPVYIQFNTLYFGCEGTKILFLFFFLKEEYKILQELYSFKKPNTNSTEVWHFLLEWMRKVKK